MCHIKHVTSVVQAVLKLKTNLWNHGKLNFPLFFLHTCQYGGDELHSQRSMGDSWKCQRGRGREGRLSVQQTKVMREIADANTNRKARNDTNPKAKGNTKYQGNETTQKGTKKLKIGKKEHKTFRKRKHKRNVSKFWDIFVPYTTIVTNRKVSFTRRTSCCRLHESFSRRSGTVQGGPETYIWKAKQFFVTISGVGSACYHFFHTHEKKSKVNLEPSWWQKRHSWRNIKVPLILKWYFSTTIFWTFFIKLGKKQDIWSVTLAVTILCQ